MDGYVNNIGTCGVCGKLIFKDRKQARSVIRRMIVNGRGRVDEYGNPLRHYESCDGTAFHIGHSPGVRGPNLNDARLHWT